MFRKSHNNKQKDGVYVKINKIIPHQLKSVRFFNYFYISLQKTSTWNLVFLRVGEKASKRRTVASKTK